MSPLSQAPSAARSKAIRAGLGVAMRARSTSAAGGIPVSRVQAPLKRMTSAPSPARPTAISPRLSAASAIVSTE